VRTTVPLQHPRKKEEEVPSPFFLRYLSIKRKKNGKSDEKAALVHSAVFFPQKIPENKIGSPNIPTTMRTLHIFLTLLCGAARKFFEPYCEIGCPRICFPKLSSSRPVSPADFSFEIPGVQTRFRRWQLLKQEKAKAEIC